MAKRTKKEVVTGVTSAQSEQAFTDFATADARIAKINADMDVQITKIRDKYAEELEKLKVDRDAAFDVMQIYATENRDILFAKKKSVETVHGTYGFRLGTPKVEKLKGFTWDACAKLAKAFLPDYVRTTEELAKDKLLADYKDMAAETTNKLPDIGIKITQSETFYVERKTEETEA